MQIKGDWRAHILRIRVPGAEIASLWGQVNSLNWWNRSGSRQRPHLLSGLIALLPSFWIKLQSLYFRSLEPLGQVSTGKLRELQGWLSRHQNCFPQDFWMPTSELPGMLPFVSPSPASAESRATWPQGKYSKTWVSRPFSVGLNLPIAVVTPPNHK